MEQDYRAMVESLLPRLTGGTPLLHDLAGRRCHGAARDEYRLCILGGIGLYSGARIATKGLFEDRLTLVVHGRYALHRFVDFKTAGQSLVGPCQAP
mgnify:CR=1 FL=1